MRLFVAIEVPEEVKQHLQELQKQLPEAKLNLAKVFHITLKFLGDVSKAEEVQKKLSEIEQKKFKAKLEGIGVFPEEDHIRVVWVGVEPKELMMELNQKINALLGTKDDKPFHPHLTLARVKFIPDKKKFKEGMQKLEVKSLTFPVNEFKLIESDLTPEGPIYTDKAVYSMKD